MQLEAIIIVYDCAMNLHHHHHHCTSVVVAVLQFDRQLQNSTDIIAMQFQFLEHGAI